MPRLCNKEHTCTGWMFCSCRTRDVNYSTISGLPYLLYLRSLNVIRRQRPFQHLFTTNAKKKGEQQNIENRFVKKKDLRWFAPELPRRQKTSFYVPTYSTPLFLLRDRTPQKPASYKSRWNSDLWRTARRSMLTMTRGTQVSGLRNL